MNRKIVFLVAAVVVVLLTAGIIAAGLLNQKGSKAVAAETKTYSDLRVCAMHPWVASDGEGKCSICGMALSAVEGHEPGAPMPRQSELYADRNSPMKIYLGSSHKGISRSDLIPITESPFYEPPKQIEPMHDHQTMDHSNHPEEKAEQAAEVTLWTCGMHPEVISDQPGICPICQMELTPLKGSTVTGGGSKVEIDPVTLQSIGVVTEEARRRDLAREIRSNGVVTVAEDSEVKLNSRVSGWVEKLHVARTGDHVEKGQPLLDIYSPELVTAQEEFLLALQSIEALQSGGLSLVESNSYDLVKAARRRLELWDITGDQIDDLKNSREVKRTMTLVSPADGIVMHKNVIEGDAVKPGMDLFRIADLDRVWIEAQVYEYELPWVNRGDRVEINSAYDPGLKIHGRIDYVYPTLEKKTRSVNIRVILPNPGLRLKPEMYVNVRILTTPKRDVLSVSKQAVIRSGKRDIVFMALGEGRFEPREVHLGIETDSYYQISHGIEEGAMIATSAQFLLDSEAKLQEAIQRRLEQRAKIVSGGGSVPEETDISTPAGHVH